MTLEPVDLKKLAGIVCQQPAASLGANMSTTATKKAQLMRKHNIQPGTPEWFQLWFSLPLLTGEKPIK